LRKPTCARVCCYKGKASSAWQRRNRANIAELACGYRVAANVRLVFLDNI
jgi:hypothetical protein